MLHGDRARLIGFDPFEHPVAIQLGGCDPVALAACARIAEDFGCDEVNLNVGCPSDRVQDGRFGACLMAEPVLVGECVTAMRNAVTVPVTVKCRLGIDDQDTETALDAMMHAVRAAGADALVVHARKAWLQGLSPRQNRDVPPLDLPACIGSRRLTLSSRSCSTAASRRRAAAKHLDHVDGVMLGRAAYRSRGGCLSIALVRRAGAVASPGGRRGAPALCAREIARGTRDAITRHVLGLFHGVPGARAFRRHLAVEGVKPGADADVLRRALALVADVRLDPAQTAAA